MDRPATTTDQEVAELCLRLAEVAARGAVLAGGPLTDHKRHWLLLNLAADLRTAATLADDLAGRASAGHPWSASAAQP